MTAQDTRNRILDAAEDLFAEKGISRTTLRAVTQAAEANLAAVHYHFGSKEALLDAVVERRAQPANQERIRTLECLESESGGAPLDVRSILSAYLMPSLRGLPESMQGTANMARLLVRIEAQPPEIVERLFRRNFGDINKIFVERLQDSLPELPKETVAERFRLTMGLIASIFSGTWDLDIIRDHPYNLTDVETRLQHALLFVEAAFKAPVQAPRTDGS